MIAPKLHPRDLQFLIEMLMPWEVDPDEAANRLRADEQLLRNMLDDDNLFQRLMDDETVLLQISPWLFFMILLRRAHRDMAQELFTIEQRGRQKVTLFDTDRVVKMLEAESIQDYLASLMASFTRVDSVTVFVEAKPGKWRGYRTHELNVEGMMRYSQTLDEPFRFKPYRRIGDVCLFLTGMFPEFINSRHRYPASRRIRPRMRGKVIQTIEDYEAQGRAFYQLAAQHGQARQESLESVLKTLSDNFVLAQKPLAYVANRYLRFSRQQLFGL